MWQLGSFTFPATGGEEPDERTQLAVGGEMNWAEFDPIMSDTTILTYQGTKSIKHQLKAIVSTASKNSLQAIADAHTAVTFIHPWDAVGKSVIVTKCVIMGHPKYFDKWDVDMTLVQR